MELINRHVNHDYLDIFINGKIVDFRILNVIRNVTNIMFVTFAEIFLLHRQ